MGIGVGVVLGWFLRCYFSFPPFCLPFVLSLQRGKTVPQQSASPNSLLHRAVCVCLFGGGGGAN